MVHVEAGPGRKRGRGETFCGKKIVPDKNPKKTKEKEKKG